MIISTALKLPNGLIVSLPAPKRHGDILSNLYSYTNEGVKAEQGFLDNTGRFVGREEALCIARLNKQLLPESRCIHHIRDLFSENLW